MITRATIGILIAAGLCFGGSLLGTVAVRSQNVTASEPVAQSPVAKRLRLDPEQAKIIEASDPQFIDDLRALRRNLEQARSMLAAAFEDENISDDEIRDRVEAAIEAHNRLERRVAEYLIAVRDHLTPKQQRQLYGLCAEKVRECGRRWRRGWGRHDDAPGGGFGRGKGRGRGGGQGRGEGHGQGQGQGPGAEHGGDARNDG